MEVVRDIHALPKLRVSTVRTDTVEPFWKISKFQRVSRQYKKDSQCSQRLDCSLNCRDVDGCPDCETQGPGVK